MGALLIRITRQVNVLEMNGDRFRHVQSCTGKAG